jgi:hypothetical protein
VSHRVVAPSAIRRLPQWKTPTFNFMETAVYLDVMTLKRYNSFMKPLQKRTTIYFDPDIHRALRFKAAETDRSVSELVNEAVKLRLAEDVEDISAFEERMLEPNLPFEDVLRDLKKRGKI